MSENWYEDYFGKGTIETRAHLDQIGRLFIADVDGGIKIPKDHDCDEMGCGSVGPHIHSVYINARTHHKLKETIKQLQDENERLKVACKLARHELLESTTHSYALAAIEQVLKDE